MSEIVTAVCLIPIPDSPLYYPEGFESQRDLYGATVDDIVRTLFQDLACDRPDSSSREQAYADFLNHLKMLYSEPDEDSGGFIVQAAETVLQLKLRYGNIWDQVQKDFCAIIGDIERTMNVVSVEGFTRLSDDTYRFTLGYLMQA